MPFPSLVPLCFALLSPPALQGSDAIVVQVIAVENQSIPGSGSLRDVLSVRVNNAGDTLLVVETDASDPQRDTALVLNGSVLRVAGDPVLDPAGASIDAFGSSDIDNAGAFGVHQFLSGTGSALNDSGVFRNDQLLLQERDLLTAPGFVANTPITRFNEVKLADSGLTLVRGTADDPLTASAFDAFLITVDASGSQSLVIKDGDPVPGEPGSFVVNVSTSRRRSDLNGAGSVLYILEGSDGLLNDEFICRDDTQLAAERDPSPVPGRSWTTFTTTSLSINSGGDVAYSGTLNGEFTTNRLIVLNDEKFRQTGDALPAIAPSILTDFSTAPVLVADRGAPTAAPEVLWHASWNGVFGANSGLFLDEHLILRAGQSIEGALVFNIPPVDETIDFSENGRYVLTKVRLNVTTDAAVRIDLGPWSSLGNATPGSSASKLRGFGQLTPGSATTLRLTGAPAARPGVLVYGTSQLDAPLLGAVLVPDPTKVVPLPPTDANGELELHFTWPDSVPAGTTVVGQVWTFDDAAANGFTVSNGVLGQVP